MARFPVRAVLVLALCAGALVCAPGAASAAEPPAVPLPSSELPSCAEGPERVGHTVIGTPCADRIVAGPEVTRVEGGPGDDVIVGANSAPVPLASGSCVTGCHLEVGSQTFEGGPGNDVVYGDRGNDTLRGNAGNDRLYGGIGDDALEGGEGDDLLSGGFGSDEIDGGEGSDFVRGDGTIDHIFDSGVNGVDTLSYATGITPGFGGGIETGASGFPAGEEGERGVYLHLGDGGENADNGIAAGGGGHDEVQADAFERIVGSPFSDYIVGGPGNEEILGGGGADVIRGEEGDDVLNGGADGDYLNGGSGSNTIQGDAADNCTEPTSGSCKGSTAAVSTRDTGKVSIGMTSVPPTGGFAGATGVYAVGSSNSDQLTASWNGSSVVFSLSGAQFDTSTADAGAGGCLVNTTSATCTPPTPFDSLLLAGMDGNDNLRAEGIPDGVSVVELGGTGADELNGSGSEDTLVDGNGATRDELFAGAGDDALIHNGGSDVQDGGEGSDLFLSVALCEGESINGGAERVGAPISDRDNASWARLPLVGVDARLDQGRAGRIGPGGEPDCSGGSFDTLNGIEDLEGSSQSDYLVGNAGPNQILGHKGADSYFGEAGSDLLLANSGTADAVINCGADLDQAVIDLKSVANDPTPIECEQVREGRVEEFNEVPLLTQPVPKPKPDRKPPQTKLRRHPAKLLRVAPGKRKLVSFRFSASEPGTHFRCKLDAKPYASCHSPRAYKVGPGRHAFRLFAIDAAGNRDRTPALFKFKVLRIHRHHHAR